LFSGYDKAAKESGSKFFPATLGWPINSTISLTLLLHSISFLSLAQAQEGQEAVEKELLSVR